MVDLGIQEQAGSKAKIQDHSISVSPSSTRLSVHRQHFLGDLGDQSERSKRANHYMKEFPANLLMALALLFRSFEHFTLRPVGWRGLGTHQQPWAHPYLQHPGLGGPQQHPAALPVTAHRRHPFRHHECSVRPYTAAEQGASRQGDRPLRPRWRAPEASPIRSAGRSWVASRGKACSPTARMTGSAWASTPATGVGSWIRPLMRCFPSTVKKYLAL